MEVVPQHFFNEPYEEMNLKELHEKKKFLGIMNLRLFHPKYIEHQVGLINKQIALLTQPNGNS